MNFIKNNPLIVLLIVFLFILLCVGSCSALKKDKPETVTPVEEEKKVSSEDRTAIRDILANNESVFSPLKDCYKDALDDNTFSTNGVVSVMVKNLYEDFIEKTPYDYLPNCKEQCKKLLNAGNNKLISSANFETILKDYDYDERIKSCFTPLPNYESEYYVLLGPERQPKLECNYKINHNITMKYINDTNIEVTDKQEVIKYDGITHENNKTVYGNVIDTKERVVIYTIEKINNDYTLKEVTSQ